MGSRGLSGKGITSTTKFLKEHRVSWDAKSFRNTEKQRLKSGLRGIQELLQDLGVSRNMIPDVTLICEDLRPGTLGACSLNGADDNFNRISISEDMSKSTLRYYDARAQQTYIHEYVHAMESALIKFYMPKVIDRVNAWNGCEFARGIIDKSIKEIGGSTRYWRRYAGRISDYAKTDHSECLAEVGAHYIIAKRNNFTGYTKSEVKFMQTVMKHLRSELKYIKRK